MPPRFSILPVQLSAAVSWTGLQGPRSSPVFPVSGSLHAAPPFPRLGPGESGSPTSRALWRRYDPHSPHHRSLICFASGAHAIPPRFVLAAASAPERAEDLPRAGIIGQPAIQLPACSHVGVSGSGRTMARCGLRMMPPFPSSPLSFRTAGFPQYGWKAGYQERPSRSCVSLSLLPAYTVVRPVCLPPSCFDVDPPKVGSVDAITAPP